MRTRRRRPRVPASPHTDEAVAACTAVAPGVASGHARTRQSQLFHLGAKKNLTTQVRMRRRIWRRRCTSRLFHAWAGRKKQFCFCHEGCSFMHPAVPFARLLGFPPPTHEATERPHSHSFPGSVFDHNLLERGVVTSHAAHGVAGRRVATVAGRNVRRRCSSQW